MKILVTGAAGLTGGAVVRCLADAGHEVLAFVRRPTPIPAASEVIVGDCRDSRALAAAVERAGALVHVAGILLGSDVAAAGIGDLPSVVAVSSAGVYSWHRSSAQAYLHGERAIAAANPRSTFVRPTMIYGALRDRNVHHVLQFADRFGFLPIFGSGDGLVQPIHYEDLAAAVAGLVGVHAERPVDAGGGAPLSIREAASSVFAALGRPPRLVGLPIGLAVLAARGVDLATGRRVAERLERLTEDRSADNHTLVTLTGVRLRGFREGVREQVLRMREEGALHQ